MKYLDKVFHHGVGNTQQYREGWDRIFGKKDKPTKRVEVVIKCSCSVDPTVCRVHGDK